MTEAPDRKHAVLSEDKKATEYLANERTFLAWVRTSIAVMSLGFVIAKFGVWLRELALRLDPKVQPHSTGMSLPIGIAMMAFGGVLALLAARRFHIVNKAIETGSVRVDRDLVLLVTGILLLLAMVMIVYISLTVARSA